MRYRMLLLLCFLSLGCTLSAQEPERETAKEARIFRLPEFERAFLCVRYFEGWHSEKNHPYVGWGHCLQPGEKYSARTMTRQQADELLRKDLRKFCAMFRHLGKDSLLLGTLAYNVGPFRLLGSGKIPKSKLIRKLEAGDRDIYYILLPLQGAENPLDRAATEDGISAAVQEVAVREDFTQMVGFSLVIFRKGFALLREKT